jgi:hypothetical protein
MYNLLMFISIATCFDHNFGHHQALNEHPQVMTLDTIQIRICEQITEQRICQGNILQNHNYDKKVERIFTKLQI